ncbi:hypothetical protein K2173_022024 [Erythroxylum novogranatense]|uniref:Uncharacterized protein n=1 Tax=Erythroxylum novogranatense TaxID=1862640 RepID=A0AAV8T2K0_9ROSI|nr:hypothetical protein K2173_022024 [Erythroxylum novogranatense]
MAGRVTLAKATLNAMPSHSMQVTWFPTRACNAVDRIVRDFIWRSSDDKRGVHLLSCDTVTKPKAVGGLGIRKCRPMNIAFLGKIVWSAHENQRKLWVGLICGKYAKNLNVLDWTHRPNCSPVWRDLLKARAEIIVGFGDILDDMGIWKLHDLRTPIPSEIRDEFPSIRPSVEY